MPKKTTEKLVMIGGKVSLGTRAEVERLAEIDDRSVSAMVRRLIEVGLSVERPRLTTPRVAKVEPLVPRELA